MKPDINLILNKLLAYSYDNLLLDTLDETYTLNKLAGLCGVKLPVPLEADYGDASLEKLLDELTAAAPSVKPEAIADILFPMPRTINYYFADTLTRDPQKAFDFLYELYGHGYKTLALGEAYGKNGYLAYSGVAENKIKAVALPACGDALYTPLAQANRIATLQNADLLSSDVIARMTSYVAAYGGTVALRAGSDEDYLTCQSCALNDAPVKKPLGDGPVKIALLDYPVPALSVTGIARNSVAREAVRLLKATLDAGIPAVVAASAVKDGTAFYLVFANDTKASGLIKAGDALSACGVFAAVDCSPVLSVLEKGTALSTDLQQFKPIYDKVGGVKHGAKAKAALGDALSETFKPLLAAAASATEEKLAELVGQN